MAVSRSLRFQILRRDNHACRYCGRSAPEVKLTVDHVVPETLGGSDHPSNLVTACADCNGGKSATPPDAATVAQVADDAARWAAAQQMVAEQMLGQRSKHEAMAERFDKAWQLQGDYPRPSTWRRSVDTFLAAGLPIEILIDCVHAAHQTQKVSKGDAFRYMCGIAWSRVRTMREEVAALVHEPKPEDVDPYARVKALKPWERDYLVVPAYEEGIKSMAQEVLEAYVDEDVERFMMLGRKRAEDLEEVAPEHDVEGFELRHAAVAALEERTWAAWALFCRAREVVDALPDGLRRDIEELEEADRARYHEPHIPEEVVMAGMLRHLAPRLRELFGTRPEPTDEPK